LVLVHSAKICSRTTDRHICKRRWC